MTAAIASSSETPPDQRFPSLTTISRVEEAQESREAKTQICQENSITKEKTEREEETEESAEEKKESDDVAAEQEQQNEEKESGSEQPVSQTVESQRVLSGLEILLAKAEKYTQFLNVSTAHLLCREALLDLFICLEQVDQSSEVLSNSVSGAKHPKEEARPERVSGYEEIQAGSYEGY